jgi:hypothetical protein
MPQQRPCVCVHCACATAHMLLSLTLPPLSPLPSLYRCVEALQSADPKLQVDWVVLPDGEEYKNMEVLGKVRVGMRGQEGIRSPAPPPSTTPLGDDCCLPDGLSTHGMPFCRPAGRGRVQAAPAAPTGAPGTSHCPLIVHSLSTHCPLIVHSLSTHCPLIVAGPCRSGTVLWSCGWIAAPRSLPWAEGSSAI